jgi:hypothetical protein
MLDNFLVEHPPVDLLAAAYFGYKSPTTAGQARNIREAAKQNSAVLGGLHLGAKAKMPEFLRTPETKALLEKMKAEWTTN